MNATKWICPSADKCDIKDHCPHRQAHRIMVPNCTMDECDDAPEDVAGACVEVPEQEGEQ